MRYRKRPARLPEAKSPAEVDERVRRIGPLLAKITAACMLGVGVLVGMHKLLHYEYLRTGYVFVTAMLLPLALLAGAFSYMARRKPRAVFTDHVEVPGTSIIHITLIAVAYICYAIAAGTMVYGFITGYPVHAFLWATGPATAGYFITQDRHLGLRAALRAKQSLLLSPEALTLTASPSQNEVRIPWTDNTRVGTSDILGTRMLPDPITGKPPYTVKFNSPITSLTQLDHLLDHFNTHPADRQLLAQPEGADLVQTLLDTTPQP